MATTRRKKTSSSGFSSTENTEAEVTPVEEETPVVEQTPEPVVEKTPEPVIESIVPPQDAGIWFTKLEEVEPEPEPKPAPKKLELKPRPKRHPRNIPKFARYK